MRTYKCALGCGYKTNRLTQLWKHNISHYTNDKYILVYKCNIIKLSRLLNEGKQVREKRANSNSSDDGLRWFVPKNPFWESISEAKAKKYVEFANEMGQEFSRREVKERLKGTINCE